MSDEVSLIIDFEHDFKLIRIISNNIVSSNIKIRAELIPMSDEIDAKEFDIALAKCRFWIDTVVSRSIVFLRDNTVAVNMMIDENGKNRCSNYIMLTPFEPTDDHLACLIQSKLSALTTGVFTFGMVELRSDNANGLIFKFVGDAQDYLPYMEEWIGKRSYFEEPWWNRDDASTFDLVPSEDADLTVRPSWAFTLDFLAQAVRGNKKDDDVVIRAEFKPKIIKGGKDDK